MPRGSLYCTIALFAALLSALCFPSPSKADSFSNPPFAGTPYDLVNAVNELRAAYGLSPYSINSILMYTAQAQADFMAANETVTHSGPGGIGVTERLLAAGYPLAGDLSLGGFRSENITGGLESMPAQKTIDGWTGDAPHLNTMISPNLTEIGAGVAVANGRVYYVIDCARPTTAGVSQISTTPIAGGPAVPGAEATVQLVEAVAISTPNSDGNVIHEVKFGQSLWQIAITYDTKIDEIKRLNNLSGNDIYPGEKLLIKMGVAIENFALTETVTPTVEYTVSPTLTSTPLSPTVPATMKSSATVMSTAVATADGNSTTIGAVIGIIALALIGGGYFTWLGSSKNKDEE